MHARGYGRFCREAAEAGASSLLVPDIPLEEAGSLFEGCRAAGIASVLLAGPGTAPERLRLLDEAATGFLYLTAYQGTTGQTEDLAPGRRDLVERVAAMTQSPLCLGFGLSHPDELQEAFSAGARIAVVGSYLARVIADAETRALSREQAVRLVFEACQELARFPRGSRAVEK